MHLFEYCLLFYSRMRIIFIAMEKKKFFNTRMIATTGVLLGVEIILQVIGNYIVIPGGFANLNFSLIIITLGAILYGPLVGGFLGLVSGALTLFAPSTISYFFAVSPVGTILTCLIKTTAAGVVAGFIAKALKNKNDLLGSILASIASPIANTGLFCVFCVIFFKQRLLEINPNNTAAALFLGLIGVNFIFEIIVNVIMVPSLYKITLHIDTHEH